MARPTKYCAEMDKKAQEYLDTWVELKDTVPSQVGLAIHCGIALSTAHKWAGEDDKTEFSDIFRAVGDYQHRELVNGALANKLNPKISSMMLTKYGYSEKVQEKEEKPAGVTVTFNVADPVSDIKVTKGK